MALIHVFDGLNHNTSYTFNGRLRDHIKGVDWENSIILRGGYRVDADYEVQPDDVLFIRKTPTAATTALVIGVVALVGAGVAAGVAMYQNKKALNSIKGAERSAKDAADTVGKLPFIKGARNTPATGRAFPYCIGRSLMTPYRLCSPHYTIGGARGENQYYNAVLEIGYNEILIEKVKLGETAIKDFTGDTTPQNGVYSFDAGTYYDERNLIEIRQAGDFETPDFNKKIVLTELSKEIKHDRATIGIENQQIEKEWRAGVVQELPTNAKAVEVIVSFDGLQEFFGDIWIHEAVILSPQWTNENNPQESDWHDFTNGFNQAGIFSNTFIYNTRKQMRYLARQEFTPEQALNKNIKIRVRRMTPKAETAKDSVFLLAVQTECYDAKKSSASELVTAAVLEPNECAKCCRLGVRIAANANTDGLLDAISVIETACARTWDGTSWSAEKTPTRNAAAWALELLTSPHHKPSRYDDDELDLASFGAWYEYCEREGFNADGVITKSARKKNTLDTICKNTNAVLVLNRLTGLMEVAIDNGRDYSVALFNSENILSLSTTKEFKRKADGKKVTYINAAAGYDTDSVTFMRDGEDYDPASDTLTETALEYVTDYAHAYKIAWRQMAEELAQPNIVTVKTGLESAYYPIFSRVEVQHKSLKNGIAHNIVAGVKWYGGLLREIELENAVEFPEGKPCGLIVNCISDNGRGVLALKVSGPGKTNVLTVDTVISISADVKPSAGNNCSFGELDENGEFTTVTRSMKITNSEESENGFTLTLVDYNAALYEYGTLPEYKSNLTSVPNGSKQTIESQREYITEAEAVANVGGAVQVAVDTVIKGTTFTNIYKVRNPEFTLEDLIRKIDEDNRNASASISISENEILLQVEDTARELVGLIDIQAGSVTALVEGGGASGQMALSLNLPVLVDEATRARLIAASTEEKVAAVYAKIEKSNNYGIKGNATSSALKALWDDAIAAGLIASQIDLTATQIAINGDNVRINGDTMFTGEVGAEKIKAALIDVEAIFANEIVFKNNLKSQNNEADAYDTTTDGIFIDSWGNAAFMGNTIIAGNARFSGVLDCGALQVEKDSTTVIRYSYNSFSSNDTDLCVAHFTIISAIWGDYTIVPAKTYFNHLYGNTNGHIYINETIEIIQIQGFQDYDHLYIWGYSSNGQQFLIYHKVRRGGPETLYYKYEEKEIQSEKLVLKMKDLPTNKPEASGMVWNDKGTLKLS